MKKITCLLCLLLLSPAIALAAESSPPPLQSEYLMDIVLETGKPQSVGSRLIVPIDGGSFTGPTLQGEILDVGADWIERRDDDVNVLDVRLTLSTDDGDLIYMSYEGLMVSNTSGAPYWRMVPKFETHVEKYKFLEKTIAVGVGKRVDGKTAYSIYRIL